MYVYSPDRYREPDLFLSDWPRPPRPAPEGYRWRSTAARSGLGSAHAVAAAELRAAVLADEERRTRPRRPYVGPALAARLGVEPTTPGAAGKTQPCDALLPRGVVFPALLSIG